MKEDTNKTKKFTGELFDVKNNIIDDTNIKVYEDWVHLMWAAQNITYERMDLDIIDFNYRYAILGKTTTIIFKPVNPWKFKSEIEEKKFKFKWVENPEEKINKIRNIIKRAYEEQPSNEWEEATVFGKAVDDIEEVIE